MRKESMRKKPQYQTAINGTAGIGIDYAGNPVLDPTANVIALSEAATQRQDDLRELNNVRIDSEIKRIDSEIAHVRQMQVLRADHQKEIDALESNRLNAIRQVDVLAVSTAADRAQTAINTLATATTSNAENLRNALANTASAIAAQLTATVSGITERLAALEKASYEGRGRSGMTDPMFTELIKEVKGLRESRSEGTGEKAGSASGTTLIVTIVSLIFSFLGAAVIIIHVLK